VKPVWGRGGDTSIDNGEEKLLEGKVYIFEAKRGSRLKFKGRSFRKAFELVGKGVIGPKRLPT